MNSGRLPTHDWQRQQHMYNAHTNNNANVNNDVKGKAIVNSNANTNNNVDANVNNNAEDNANSNADTNNNVNANVNNNCNANRHRPLCVIKTKLLLG